MSAYVDKTDFSPLDNLPEKFKSTAQPLVFVVRSVDFKLMDMLTF